MAPSRKDAETDKAGLPSYLGRLTQAPLLTKEEEIVLTRAAQAGDRHARTRLVESNMRLVINIAKSYHSRAIPLEDLIQEGAIGLINAIERFDPERGFRFSTYATHWIRQAVGRAIDLKAKTIRLPAHISQTLRKVERVRGKILQTQGREASAEEIARVLGISEHRLLYLTQASQELISLDMRVGGIETSTLGSLIRDDGAGDPETLAVDSEALDEFREILATLTERERTIVVHRLKEIGNGSAEGRDQLCRDLAISRERARQIEVQAIRKLRDLVQQRQQRESPPP